MKKETNFQAAYVNGLARLSKLTAISVSQIQQKYPDLLEEIKSFLPTDDLFSPIGEAFIAFCSGGDPSKILEDELQAIYDKKKYIEIEDVEMSNLKIRM